MLRFLFPRLTPVPARGEALFACVTAVAREPHWYVAGEVPDTLDGRFRTLATVTALAIMRLEQFGAEGGAASVALTERFIEVMETEHREFGLGDPKLGRTVRKLVRSLEKRVDLWRSAVAGEHDWTEATGASLYPDDAPELALEHSAGQLRQLWSLLQRATLDGLLQGRIG